MAILMLAAVPVLLNRWGVPRFYFHGIFKNPFTHCRHGGNHDGSDSDEDSHENPRWPVLFVAIYKDENFSCGNKTHDGDPAILYGAQCFYGRWR